MQGKEIRSRLQSLAKEQENLFAEADLYDENDKNYWDRLEKTQKEIEKLKSEYQDIIDGI